MKTADYTYYICGGGYYYRFVERNPEFNNPGFHDFVVSRNRADRDSGELGDICKHEILRLAHEYEERLYRFPACYGDPKSRI